MKALGGCEEGSPEEIWLKQDLAAHPNACIVAYGHHALFSSGVLSSHARHTELRPFWQDLYAAHADLVLAGHEHSYERFAPQNPEGHADPEHGIRQSTVGTGGRSHTFLGFAQPNSEVRNSDAFGVLKLTLTPGKYTWEFVPEAGGKSRFRRRNVSQWRVQCRLTTPLCRDGALRYFAAGQTPPAPDASISF